MQIELPESVVDALRDALTPVIERLIDERVEQRRPLLLSVSQVAEELSCSRASVYGLIHGGHLEAIATGRTFRVATATLHQYVEELTKPSYERSVVSSRATRSRKNEPPVASSNRNRSQQMPRASVLTATKPPRTPRTRPPKMSKKEIAESRCTIAEFADRWYGLDSATALLERAGVALTEDTTGQETFRYGDLVSWMEGNKAEFQQWLEEFDPMLKRRISDD
jgi:excisionase family DNA binding protein